LTKNDILIFSKFVDNNVFLCWYHGWFRPAVVDS